MAACHAILVTVLASLLESRVPGTVVTP